MKTPAEYEDAKKARDKETLDKSLAAAQRLKEKLGNDILAVGADGRGIFVSVPVQRALAALALLQRDDATPFDLLSDVTAVDWSAWSEQTGLAPRPARFTVYYNLYSVRGTNRIFVECEVGDGQSVPTASCLYKSANWAEREVYDMFGIHFSGHPDLRRILMTYDYDGFPLRKEFPLAGPVPQDFPQE